ncbi:50S ribosomal protein L4, partial [Staphylococcus epidermidis]|uniref:50S ribosomal protein L4 n=1 Tax=Staphylococcus epidermidis TaxID=1282 RepID=UPI0037D9BA76
MNLQPPSLPQPTHPLNNPSPVPAPPPKPSTQKPTPPPPQPTIPPPQSPPGGVLFPPTPTSYAYKIPNKIPPLPLPSPLSFKL